MRIKKKYNTVEILLLLSLIMIIVLRNYVWLSTYFYMIPALFMLLIYIRSDGFILHRNQTKVIVPFVLFLAFSLMTSLWAARSSYVMSAVFIITRIYLVVMIFSLFINDIDDLIRQLEIFSLSGVLMLIYLFISTPGDVWREALTGSFSAASDEGRLGRTIGYHPNELGHICVIFSLLALYIGNIKKKKIYIVFASLYIVVTFFTKSRTSLLMILLMIALYYIASEERAKKQIFAVLGVIALVMVTYWAVFNIPTLYNLVGFRFAGLFGSASEQDASTLTRIRFLSYAFELFETHPFVGVGLDNFKYYAFNGLNAWAEVYSHSNWGELLSGTGLIGTSLFYGPQIAAMISLIKSLRRLKSSDRKLCAFLLSFIIINIVFDIQKISYDKLEIMYPTVITVLSASLLRKRTDIGES